MTPVTIHLLKPAKGRTITYQAELRQRTATALLVQAHWTTEMGRVDIGHVVFEPGDTLYEHFYSDRWYNVFELHAADGRLKGWYCNITRPARFTFASSGAVQIESEDLELDLFVAPDRRSMHILDEEEYAARGLATHEPASHQAARAALEELIGLAERGVGPFAAGGSGDERAEGSASDGPLETRAD